MATGLEDFGLCLDDMFWRCASWWDGAHAVFEGVDPCGLNRSGTGLKRNFLQHCARLGRVNFRLTIEDSDRYPEWEQFRRQLEKLITLRTFTRPYLAEDQSPKCSCRRRLLYESCIWDRYEKWRRILLRVCTMAEAARRPSTVDAWSNTDFRKWKCNFSSGFCGQVGEHFTFVRG